MPNVSDKFDIVLQLQNCRTNAILSDRAMEWMLDQ